VEDTSISLLGKGNARLHVQDSSRFVDMVRQYPEPSMEAVGRSCACAQLQKFVREQTFDWGGIGDRALLQALVVWQAVPAGPALISENFQDSTEEDLSFAVTCRSRLFIAVLQAFDSTEIL
jgi:hypothetical protein